MIREPVVAGMFYYFDPGHLKKQLKDLFSDVKTKPTCFGVVSPHAGYEYSGKTAAFAVSSLKPAKTFIILGPNHHGFGAKFSIMSSGTWRTPLGEVSVNPDIAKDLECKILEEDSSAHSQEHSIEVQLPFLQQRFKDFRIVPICIMNTDYSDEFLKECEALGAAIAKSIAKSAKGKETGVIASSDFSHYLPKGVAEQKDSKALKKILALDTKGFFKTLESVDASVCGYGPIAVLMAAAKALGLKGKLIQNSTSGDTTGDFGSVVSYYAIGFE